MFPLACYHQRLLREILTCSLLKIKDMNITFPARVPTKEPSLFKSKLVWIIAGVVGFVFLLVVITTILLLRFVYVKGKKVGSTLLLSVYDG